MYIHTYVEEDPELRGFEQIHTIFICTTYVEEDPEFLHLSRLCTNTKAREGIG